MDWIDFAKLHGLGNDYLVVDARRLGFELTAGRVRLICDRHVGVGADGIVAIVGEGDGADFRVRIFNPDGSEAEKSGNGLRIVARFLYDHGYTEREAFTIHTPGGVVRVQLVLDGRQVTAVRVEMGRAVIDRALRRLTALGREYDVTALSLGNPHCVLIVDDVASVDVERLGAAIERHSEFPRRTNVQIAQVMARDRVRAFVWERGAGRTRASGSSACAVAVACAERGLVERSLRVQMEGGELAIAVSEDLEVTMTGPAQEVFIGRFAEEFTKCVRSSEQAGR